MPSFNLEKLRRLVDDRDAAALNLSDINHRLSDARSEMGRLKSILMKAAVSHDAQDALMEKLTMPTEELCAMTNAEILEYQVTRNEKTLVFMLNVNIQTFNKFIHERDNVMRLEKVVAERKLVMDRFAIVPRLLTAVGEWGFNTREMGL